MKSLEKIDPKVKARQIEAPVVPVVHVNTRVKLLRTDVDTDFSIAQWEKGKLGDRLRAFAERQIETCPAEVIGGEEHKKGYLEKVRDSHPVDSVPYLITLEPCLMLSNLTENQLRELISELRDGKTEANRSTVASAISTIQGIFIGRASSRQEQR